MVEEELNFTIERLGDCRFPSPMQKVRFTGDRERIMYHSLLDEIKPYLHDRVEPPTLELAGPRERIFFDPACHRLRHRHLRRPLPRDQQRDPRRGAESPPPLRRRQDLRLPLRLRGVGEAPRSRPPRPHSRGGGPDRRAGGHHPLPQAGARRTRRRWSIPWRS